MYIYYLDMFLEKKNKKNNVFLQVIFDQALTTKF